MTGPAGVSVQSAVEVAGGPGGGAVLEETLVLEGRQSTVTATPTLALMVRILYIFVHSLCEYPYLTSFSATFLLLNSHIYLCPTSYSYSLVSVLSVLSVYS